MRLAIRKARTASSSVTGRRLRDFRPDRHVVLERCPEIAGERLAEPFGVLHMQRPVEAVQRLEAGDGLRRGVDAERRLAPPSPARR